MLNHYPENKWQHGLMKLIGCMEMKYWNILWYMASLADDDGFCESRNLPIECATMKIGRRYPQLLRDMREFGLVRVARKRAMSRESPGKPWKESQTRIMQIYTGIQHGRIPAGAEEYMGLMPAYWKRGRNVTCQTHKLFRAKFKCKRGKSTLKRKFPSSDLAAYAHVVPSISYQLRQEKIMLERRYQRCKAWKHGAAMKRRFL